MKLTPEQLEEDHALQQEIIDIATQRDKLRRELEIVDERLSQAIRGRRTQQLEWAGDPTFVVNQTPEGQERWRAYQAEQVEQKPQ
jgi:hypothetical protein